MQCNPYSILHCSALSVWAYVPAFGRMNLHCTLYIHCIVPQSIDPNAASPPLCILNPQLADDEDQNTPKTHLLRLKSDIKMKYNGFEGISLILKC